MDYLPSSYLLLLYGLWIHYCMFVLKWRGLPLILLLKILCFSVSIMQTTWALKRGYGHLNKRCHEVILVLSCSISRHNYTSGHIWALWEPCQDWLHCTNPLHGTHLSPDWHTCRSQHGRWGHACKAPISEDRSMEQDLLCLIYWLLHWNVLVWDRDANWKIMALSLLRFCAV